MMDADRRTSVYGQEGKESRRKSCFYPSQLNYSLDPKLGRGEGGVILLEEKDRYTENVYPCSGSPRRAARNFAHLFLFVPCAAG